MIHRPIPFCITLTQTGEAIPDVLPNGEDLKQHRQSDQAEIALRTIFDLSHRIDALLMADVSPEVIDFNQLPEVAIQNTLRDQTEIYSQTDNRLMLQQQLRERYYNSFFEALDNLIIKNDIKIGFNCSIFNDTEYSSSVTTKPILSLLNGGDHLGEPQFPEQKMSCPANMLRDIRDIFSARFADIDGSVLLNATHHYSHVVSRQPNGSLPWIDLLIGRSLVENSQGKIGEKRLINLRDRFENIFVMISKYYEWL